MSKTKKAESTTTTKIPTMFNVSDIKTEFLSKDGKIQTELLKTAMESIIQDAEKANNGQLAAGRRFRLNTISLSKIFKDMREATPKTKG